MMCVQWNKVTVPLFWPVSQLHFAISFSVNVADGC